MKILKACTVCGKRAKKIPLEAGFNLCQKHYNIQLKYGDKKGWK